MSARLQMMSAPKLFRAAVLEELNKPLAIVKLEVPHDLSVGQVLVRLKYSGVCGAQLGEMAGVKGPDKYLPHGLGHEGSGIVRACGPGVKHVTIGDHVVIHWRKGVGIDAQFPQYWCPDRGRYIGGGANNTFQEMAVVSENRLTKIPKDIPLDEAALFGCAVTTGLGVVFNDVNLKPGQSVVVFGCGGVGLNVLQGCSLVSAYPIYGVDIAEAKLQQAIVMGATQVCLPSAFPLKHCDVAIDTTGNPAVIEQAWKIADKVCLVAQVRADKHIELQTLPMHNGKKLIASDGGMTDPTADIPRYIKLLKSGRLNLRGLITHQTDLAGLNTMLDLIRTGVVGRCIINL